MNVLEPTVVDRMREMFEDAKGVRAVSRELEVSMPTVCKYLKHFEAQMGKQFRCGCGRPLRHRALCEHRKRLFRGHLPLKIKSVAYRKEQPLSPLSTPI